MSGYRQSNYDPYAHEQPGAPLRPYDKVQWAGIALLTASVALNLVYFAGRLDWIDPLLESSSPGFLLLFFGLVLLNSRRGPPSLVGSEQLEKNRRLLIITIIICAAVLGAAFLIDFIGA